MKILITGVAGFIGFSLANKLLKNKKNLVYGIDNFDRYYSPSYKKRRISRIISNKRFFFSKIDITNKNKLIKFFQKNMFDIVFHFAAQAGVRYSLINPKKYYDVNDKGFKNILDAIIKIKPKKIIYASSSSVYGNTHKFPTRENDKLRPNNIYAKTKIRNEKLAQNYKNKYKLNICGIRFFTVYGEWGRPDMFLFKLLKSYKSNKHFYLNNYGEHKRDFTYIGDVVSILIKLSYLKNFDFNIANICSSKPISIKNICEHFKIKYNFNNIKLIKKHKADVLNTHGSNKLIKKITKFKSFTNFEYGFKKTIKWYLKSL
tara:strand:- start:2368 stop:3315 length:948 start_codon:yes stop_codon:yes gene_type:complete